MVQITTIHDTELNQKVFKVRADEGYARSTKVTISETETEPSVDNLNYSVDILVNVYRNVESSYLAIMDYDTTIQIEEWLGTDSEKTVTVDGLSYDAEHQISVMFMGNEKCLKSHSNSLTYQMENPNVVKTKLTNDSASDYSVTTTPVLRAILTTDDGNNTPIRNKQINIFVDGVQLNRNSQGEEISVKTNSSGLINYNCRTQGTPITRGKHKIEFVYSGTLSQSEAYARSTKTIDYSIGRKLTITSYPQVFINDDDNPVNTVTGTVTDYFNRPLNNVPVYFEVGSEPYPSATSNAQGNVSISVGWTSDNAPHRIICKDNNAVSDGSDYITTYSTTVSNITITPSTTIVTPNTSSTIDIKVGSGTNRSNIKVVLTGDITGTYYTNEKSRISVRYTGTGSGDVTFTATVGNVTETATIEDLLFYYGNQAPNYAPYKVFNASVQSQTDGLKLNIPDYSHLAVGLGDGTGELGDYELLMTVNQGASEGVIHNYGSWISSSSGYEDPTTLNEGYPTDQRNGSIYKIQRIDGTVSFQEHHPTSDPSAWWTMPFTWENTHENYPVLIWKIRDDLQPTIADYLIFSEIKLKRL